MILKIEIISISQSYILFKSSFISVTISSKCPSILSPMPLDFRQQFDMRLLSIVFADMSDLSFHIHCDCLVITLIRFIISVANLNKNSQNLVNRDINITKIRRISNHIRDGETGHCPSLSLSITSRKVCLEG